MRVAQEFEAAGARWIHLVDLDAARSGQREHLDEIRAVVAAVECRLEVGGGVRSVAAAAELLEAGVARVVVGTAAVEMPELVDELCREYPGRIAVGLDARGAEVAIRGWSKGSGTDLEDLARRFEDRGVAALVVTEIGRDGTMAGPAEAQLAGVLAVVTVPVVASGGVGSISHVRTLARLRAGGRGLAGVIIGRALYEGRVSLADAVAAASVPSDD